MKLQDKKELGKYLRFIADEIGLRDWYFEMFVTDDIPDGGLSYDDEDGSISPLGSCTPIPGRKAATIRFSPDIRESKPSEIRELVTHELVHCHFGPLREIPREGLVKHLSQESYSIFMHAFDLQWEHSVDALACALAKNLPLIKWPE